MKHIAALAGGLFLHSVLAGCGGDVPTVGDLDPSLDASVRAADASPGTAPTGSAAVDAAVSQGPAAVDPSKLDLLLVVDNSYSMASEQKLLAAHLPRLLRALAAGDRTPELPAGDPSDRTRYFTPVRSLHVGVVTTELAVMKTNVRSLEVCTASSNGDGNDDARLQTGVDVAANGQTAPSTSLDDGVSVGDVLIPARPECQGRQLDDPGHLAFETAAPTSDARAEVVGEAALQLGCVATVGVLGCPFEQQLEAMWKAVAPSTSDDFLDGTTGQGNPSGANQGFVRDDAALAVLMFSDEDDCSITDAGRVLFDTTTIESKGKEWSSVPYNLRCGRADADGRDDLLRDVDRYVEGLRSLKPGHPERIMFVGLVGIPEQAETLIALGRHDDVLALPDMEFRTQSQLQVPYPSCGVERTVAGPRERAYPARRIVRFAQGLGDNALLFSICRKDYTSVMSSLVDLYAAQPVQL